MSLLNLPPAAATVECSGVHHQLIWRVGALEAVNHPDPDADRAFAALGGPPCLCVQLLDVWRAHAADPRVLVLGPRGPQITVVHVNRAQQGSATMYGRSGVDPGPPPVGLEDLLMLRGAITRRLQAACASQLIASVPAPDARLHAALYGRLLPALARWLGELPDLHLEIIPADHTPSLSTDGTTINAAVSLDWLVDVWGAGLEIVSDRFVLSARPVAPTVTELRCVDLLMASGTCKLELS